MSERDVMTLLAQANPVQVDDLVPLDFPDLARRRVPSRRLVLAIALVAAAASLVGVFGFGGHASSLSTGPARVSAPGSNESSWKTIALSDASMTLGAQVVLPDTPLVAPSDAAAEARATDCPVGTTDAVSPCVVAVSFPAQSIGIDYFRPAPDGDPLASYKAAVAAVNPHADAQLLDLNGVPGIWIDYPGIKSVVEFVTGGTRILVFTQLAKYDEADLQAIAQSIVDRSK
jgi:hypothetical protein